MFSIDRTLGEEMAIVLFSGSFGKIGRRTRCVTLSKRLQ